MRAKAREGRVLPSLSRNDLGVLHSIFAFGERRGWCTRNPVRLVDKPQVKSYDEIRYLLPEEIEALLLAFPEDEVSQTDRVLTVAAVMTGLRQGELLALRWRDIDWTCGAASGSRRTLARDGTLQRAEVADVAAAPSLSRGPSGS